MLGRVVHQQVHEVAFAVHLHQLRFEIARNVGENGTKTVYSISIQHPGSILCDKDQVNVKLKHAIPTV